MDPAASNPDERLAALERAVTAAHERIRRLEVHQRRTARRWSLALGRRRRGRRGVECERAGAGGRRTEIVLHHALHTGRRGGSTDASCHHDHRRFRAGHVELAQRQGGGTRDDDGRARGGSRVQSYPWESVIDRSSRFQYVKRRDAGRVQRRGAHGGQSRGRIRRGRHVHATQGRRQADHHIGRVRCGTRLSVRMDQRQYARGSWSAHRVCSRARSRSVV